MMSVLPECLKELVKRRYPFPMSNHYDKGGRDGVIKAHSDLVRAGWTKPEQTKGMLYEALSMSSKGYGWTEIIDKLVPETQQEEKDPKCKMCGALYSIYGSEGICDDCSAKKIDAKKSVGVGDTKEKGDKNGS